MQVVAFDGDGDGLVADVQVVVAGLDAVAVVGGVDAELLGRELDGDGGRLAGPEPVAPVAADLRGPELGDEPRALADGLEDSAPAGVPATSQVGEQFWWAPVAATSAAVIEATRSTASGSHVAAAPRTFGNTVASATYTWLWTASTLEKQGDAEARLLRDSLEFVDDVDDLADPGPGSPAPPGDRHTPEVALAHERFDLIEVDLAVHLPRPGPHELACLLFDCYPFDRSETRRDTGSSRRWYSASVPL